MVCARVIECLLNTTSDMFGICQVIFLQIKSVLLIDVDTRSEQSLMAPARSIQRKKERGVVVRECV